MEDDTNLLNVDPLFIDAESSDYRLRPSSPLIRGSKSSSTNEIYVTPSNSSGPKSNYIYGSGTYNLADFEQWIPNGQGNNRNPDYLSGMRVSYGGEIYECIES